MRRSDLVDNFIKSQRAILCDKSLNGVEKEKKLLEINNLLGKDLFFEYINSEKDVLLDSNLSDEEKQILITELSDQYVFNLQAKENLSVLYNNQFVINSLVDNDKI